MYRVRTGQVTQGLGWDPTILPVFACRGRRTVAAWANHPWPQAKTALGGRRVILNLPFRKVNSLLMLTHTLTRPSRLLNYSRL